jgi:hypothetical protein
MVATASVSTKDNPPMNLLPPRLPMPRWMLQVLVLWTPMALLAQHLHLNVGAPRPEAGTQLAFINGASFSTNSGWFLSMPKQTNGLHQGLYTASSLTLTALPTTPDNGGPASWTAAPGSLIMAEIVSLRGPVGGEIAFWDSDGVAEADVPTFRIPVGTTNGSWRFKVSEGDGSPQSDPYGHIHGRHFTTTQPGLYTLGIRAVDVSTSGPAGGPHHFPSPILEFYLQADTTLAYVIKPSGPAVRIALEKGRRYSLVTSAGVGPNGWRYIWGPVLGNGTVADVIVAYPTDPARFYLLLVE